MEIDHIIPRDLGGPTAWWNLQALHRRCNAWKRNKLTRRALTLATEHELLLFAGTPAFLARDARTGPCRVAHAAILGEVAAAPM